jgi:hypothetical protein
VKASSAAAGELAAALAALHAMEAIVLGKFVDYVATAAPPEGVERRFR